MARLFRLTLRFFQLSGLCIFTDPRHAKTERLLLIWNLAHIFALSLITIYVIHNPSSVFSGNDAIGRITDVIQLACPFVAHFSVLIETIRTKPVRCAIWRQLTDIDRRMRKIVAIDGIRNKCLVRYLTKVGVAHAMCIATEIRIIGWIGENVVWWNLWMASIYTLVTIRAHHFYYIWFVDELKWRMEVHCEELAKCGNLRDIKEQVRRIEEIRKNHGRMWLVSERMNGAFGWALLTTITANFVCLSVNLYWNYAALYFGSNRFWLESLLGSLPLTAEVVVLCYSCEEWQRAASEFSTRLHRLQIDKNNARIRNAVKLFSLQIRLQKFHLSARGFFDINFDLLKGIIAAIATYLLILIQFMPNDDTFRKNDAQQSDRKLDQAQSE